MPLVFLHKGEEHLFLLWGVTVSPDEKTPAIWDWGVSLSIEETPEGLV
jgi:hypothetical protein